MSTRRIEQAMTKRPRIRRLAADLTQLIPSQPIHLEQTLTSAPLLLAHKGLMLQLTPCKTRKTPEEASKFNSQSYPVEQTLSLCTVKSHRKSCLKELKFSSSQWPLSTCQSILRQRASARVTLAQPSSAVFTSCNSRCTSPTLAT